MRNTEVVAWVSFLTLLVGCQARPSQVSPTTGQPAEVLSETGSEVVAPKEESAPAAVQEPAKLGPHRVAYDFLLNRPLSHRLDSTAGAVVVDASALDFVRYIHGNHPNDWNLGTEMAGETGASLNKKRIGGLWIPAPGISPEGVIRMRVYSPAKGNLKLKVNGQETSSVSLAEGWQTVDFETKSLAAENAILVEFSGMGRISNVLSGGGVKWVSVGARAADSEQKISSLPLDQGPFSISKNDTALVHVWALPEAKIDYEVTGKSGCQVKFVWHSEADGGLAEAGSINVTIPDSGKAASFASVPVQNQVARVMVEAGDGCEETTFQRLAMVVPGEAEKRKEVAAPKRIVFWLIDTLRADYLPIHFDTDVRAPNLKRLAAEGASFKVAFVQGNESKTSHASLFSGMFPSKHGLVGKGKLKPEHEIMTEAIKAGGYRTAGFIANGYVSGPWGFEQGWDTYRNHIRDQLPIHGRAMTRTGLDWVSANKDVPFFLYLGTSDPHATYREHADIIGNYDTEPYNGRFKKACYGEDLGLIKSGSLKVTDRDKTRIINLYKNEIEFNDKAFGELRAGFEEMGIWEDTMVVVTSDHGDEFWEHGSVGHGHSIYQDQVHVPILIYYPPLIPANTVVEAGADVLDIYPTIVDVMGKTRPRDLQGKSLIPLILKETGDYPEPATATQYKLHYTMQMQEWKLYLRRGEYQLYDRKTDITEQTDVSSKHPLASRWLLDSMGWFRAYRTEWDKQSWGAASNLRPDFIEAARAAKRN